MKLSKSQYTRHSELTASLASAESIIEAAIEAYNLVVAEAKELRYTVVSELNEEFDNKSEGWQNSDAGSYARICMMIDAWECITIEDHETKLTLATDFDDLPTES
jgi:hypothetical protein